MMTQRSVRSKSGKAINCFVLISFVLTGIPVRNYAAVYRADNLRTRAATTSDTSINTMLGEMDTVGFITGSLRKIPGEGLSVFLSEAGIGADEAALKIAAEFPKNIAGEELSFMVGKDGLWTAGPEREKENQTFILLRSLRQAGLSRGIEDFIGENEGKIRIEEKGNIVKILIAAAEPSLRRQMLLQIASTLTRERKMIAGMAYDRPSSVLTPLLERMLLGAQLEREFLDGYKKNTELALSQFKELDDLIRHLRDPESGEYSLVITPELAKKWELKERLAKMVKDMAVVAVAGMRNNQNPLFPGDLNSPMNILLALLLSNELAEMSLETAQRQKTEEPQAIVGGEVRYNTPIVSEMFRRRFAKLGFTVHSPARGVYLPIGATSYITTVLNIMFTIYDTSSHSARSVYGVKLMGNLKASISPFLEAFLVKIGIDPGKYKMSRSEGAQLLVEDMVELANRIDRKIDRAYAGENLVIDLASGTDPKILFDIDNPIAKGNIDVVGKYSKYLRNAYVTEDNRRIVREAFKNGIQMGFDQTRGAAYRFFSNVYKEVFGADTAENIQWTGTMPDSFFGDTGMSDFNSKQPPDTYVAEYVEVKGTELDDYFSGTAFGTTLIAEISEQDLARAIGKEPRPGKLNDIVSVRFKVFSQEEENMLKRFGIAYRRLSSGKLLAYYRPKISDFSQDVSLLEVVINSKLPAFMLSKPVGYVHPITDPDGDRFVVSQVERNNAQTKQRLGKMNIAYVVLSDEKVLAVYVPNQTFLQIQDAYLNQLGGGKGFSQDIGNPDAATFFAIKTTVSSDTWMVLYTKKGVPAIQVPVGFKEIGAIMRKVELQLLTNEVRVKMGLPRRMVVVHDIFGTPVRLGYNPRLLFAGEESGGMVQGSSDMLRSEDNLRFYLSWREKNAIEASICTTIMLSKRFNQARDAALARGVLQKNLYNDEGFLEGISLSRMLSEIFGQNGMERTAELRADVLLIDPLTAALASRDERDKMTKDGIYRRDANFNFYLSLAFALQDGHVTLDDVKAVLKEVLLADKEMLKRITAVTDSTAPQMLLRKIDDIQRFEFVGDAVRMEFSGGAWQVIRPSGTEPKVKSYPSTDDARFSAVICNAIGEVFPEVFFEMIKGRIVADMPATTAYITKMLKADPDLVDPDMEDTNKNTITLRQRLQYQRGLLVDTVPGWVDGDVQKFLESQTIFQETAADGTVVSSVNVFLGPAKQREALRYDPESHILYAGWNFDTQMHEAKTPRNKIDLLRNNLATASTDGGAMLTEALLVELDYVMRMLKVQDYKRALQILLTSTDSVKCINEIAALSGKKTGEVEKAMLEIDVFKPVVADARLRRARKNYDPGEFKSKQLDFNVDPDGYTVTEGSFDSPRGVITEYLDFMHGVVNSVAFAFRDNMDRFVGRFLGMPGEYDKPDLTDILDRLDAYIDQVNGRSGTAEKGGEKRILDMANYLLSSGIGANEMFSHLRAQILNMYFVRNNIPFQWIVVNNPAHLRIIPAEAFNKNTVVFEMSRSGSTEETRNFAVKTKGRFKQRIGAANKGALNAIEKELSKEPDAMAMIFDDIPEDIGGRQMNRKTLMLYAPLYLAIRLGLKDKEHARDLLKDYVETSFDSNQRLSYAKDRGNTGEAVTAGEFLFRHRESGRNGFAVIYNNELFPLFKEFEQLNNEGANKITAAETNNNIVIGYSLEDSAKMYKAVFEKTGSTQIGIFLLNKNAVDYQATSEYIKSLRARGIPVMEFALDLKGAEEIRNNNLEALKYNLRTAERASYLIQDMVVYFTYLTKQDANSNPQVKLVRDITPINFEGIKFWRAGKKPAIWISFDEVDRGLQEKKEKDREAVGKSIDKIVEGKEVIGEISRKNFAEIGNAEFEYFNEAGRQLEKVLGMKAGSTGLAISKSLAGEVFAADLGEAGGNPVPKIDAAIEKARFSSFEERAALEQKKRADGFYKQEVLNPQDSTMRFSVALKEDSPWEFGNETLEKQVEDYIVAMWENRDIMYMPLMYMDVDVKNSLIKEIAGGIIDRFAELGVTCPMLGLPGSAHTGLEGVFTHAKNSLSISILYTEAYGGELGQSTVEEGTFPDGSAWKLTVDDMTYGYGIGNVSRMAFGGAPGIILELKDKDELPRAKAILDKALDGVKDRILPPRTTPSGRTKIPAGLPAIALEHDPQMTLPQLQELWNNFETSNSNIFSKLAGKDL
ncbi:MAG: hypothetical protein PHC33_02950, partial [Candidatus Omnitrophica bacterium]|nr:hypothetical protein [Candidatus Omnitrophota bacterium]